MSVQVSKQVLNGMGFHEMAESEKYAVTFHSVHVYELRGVVVDDGVITQTQGTVSETAYKIAVGNNINEVSKALIGDELISDLEAWTKENHCNPPYVLIHFGPTTSHQPTGRYIKEEGSLLVTYESFTAAKLELRNLEDKVLPSLLTSLACSFDLFDNVVKLVPLSREVFGVTQEGRFLQDILIQISASGYVSRRLPLEGLQAALKSTSSLAATLNSKVSRFFHLAMKEDDRMKRFLYFFLAIEITTHATFLSIDHTSCIKHIVNGKDRIRLSTIDFFASQQERWTNLKDRFIWCAVCVWAHIMDSDVDEFKRLKKVRDDIAHGSISEPPPDLVNSAEKLATKLLKFIT